MKVGTKYPADTCLARVTLGLPAREGGFVALLFSSHTLLYTRSATHERRYQRFRRSHRIKDCPMCIASSACEAPTVRLRVGRAARLCWFWGCLPPTRLGVFQVARIPREWECTGDILVLQVAEFGHCLPRYASKQRRVTRVTFRVLTPQPCGRETVQQYRQSLKHRSILLTVC